MVETVRYESANAVARVTIDRAEAKNALGPHEWRLLRAAVARAGDDPAVRVLLLTGAGGAFSAGGDLRTLPERLAEPVAPRRARLAQDARIISDLRELGKPTIAVIDGPAMGAALNLALACDLRVASTRSRLGASFHRIGLTSDFGGIFLLPQIVGVARALEILLLAEPLSAAEALAAGLVHRVYEEAELGTRVDELCARLAALPPLAVALTKQGIYRAARMNLDAALEYEAASQAIICKTEDAAEGVQAFLEKRPPRFQGK